MAGLRTTSSLNPAMLVCVCGATDQCAIDVATGGFRKALVMTASAILHQRDALVAKLREQVIDAVFCTEIDCGPPGARLEVMLRASVPPAPDVIIGWAAGFGRCRTHRRFAQCAAGNPGGPRHQPSPWTKTDLVCLPVTSVTGSEVSPNAILLDEEDELKKGTISPWLVPDGTYIDPHQLEHLQP